MPPKHDVEREKHPEIAVATLREALIEAAPGATYTTDDGYLVSFGTAKIKLVPSRFG